MRGTKSLVGLAMLALAVTAVIGSGASADPVAHSAGLKKCLKKAKAIQDPVKRKRAKKRCRKKFGTTAPGTTGKPLIRATLNWSAGSGNTDYDLYVFEGSTTASVRSATNPIAQTTFSPNAKGATGTETFTDLTFAVPGRNFQFGVCKQDGGNDGSTYTITYVTADGVSHSDTQSSHGDGYAAKYVGNPPPIAPNGFTPCPAP